MKNYTDCDYALNKINKNAIVYRFADEVVEVTLADFLAENPDKTEADFRALKEFSNKNTILLNTLGGFLHCIIINNAERVVFIGVQYR